MPAYISEVSYAAAASSDFVEIAVEAGTDVSSYSIYVYKSNGDITEGPLSLGSVVSTNAGLDVYVVNDGTSGFAAVDAGDAVALVDDEGNVLQFISFEGNTVEGGEGPADGLTSTNIGTADDFESLESVDGGSNYNVQTAPSEGTIPCYFPGTLIDTPDGPRAVETLQIGDLVETQDHGPLPIRWLRHGDQPLEDATRDARPIMIRAGAFGLGCPARDLVVSPQHRILVGALGQLDGVFDGPCFEPAKALTGLPRIRTMMGRQRITWVHFAFDSHEVVTANGCLSESLLLGPVVLNGMTALQRRAAMDLFGASRPPDAALNGPPARMCLKVGEVRRTLERYARSASGFARAA